VGSITYTDRLDGLSPSNMIQHFSQHI